MNRLMKLSLLFGLLLLVFNVNAQKERKHIRQGNRDYDKAIIDSVTTDTARYIKAEDDYRLALEKSPNDWSASYNLANALYKQAKYAEATKQFQAVSGMENENKEEMAQSFHNLGNSLLLENKLEPAIEAFKNSLRNNPADYDTKYNLAWAQDKLKQQQQDQQQQDQDKDKDQDQDKKDQEQDQNKDKDKQDENQDPKDQDKQNQDQQDQNQDQQQQKQNQISKEDALRILQALQNDEKEVQEKVQKQKGQPVKRNTEKDW